MTHRRSAFLYKPVNLRVIGSFAAARKEPENGDGLHDN
jgi:hypothetical protein